MSENVYDSHIKTTQPLCVEDMYVSVSMCMHIYVQVSRTYVCTCMESRGQCWLSCVLNFLFFVCLFFFCFLFFGVFIFCLFFVYCGSQLLIRSFEVILVPVVVTVSVS